MGSSRRDRAKDFALASWFFAIDMVLLIAVFLPHQSFGSDGSLYTAAARAWLAGQDPWAVDVAGALFAAPPASLLPFVPLVVFPDPVIRLVAVMVGLAAGMFALVRLHVPRWWLLFPPLLIAIWHGSAEPLMLALLLTRWRFLAPIVKVYAVIPLVLGRKIRDVVFASFLITLTIPFLPWWTFLEESGAISATLRAQSNGGLSAFAAPLIALIAVGALVVLGRERMRWLAIPTLWPYTNIHYATVSLPAMPNLPLVAVAAAVPLVPYLIPIAIILTAIPVVARRVVRAPPKGQPADKARVA